MYIWGAEKKPSHARYGSSPLNGSIHTVYDNTIAAYKSFHSVRQFYVVIIALCVMGDRVNSKYNFIYTSKEKNWFSNPKMKDLDGNS